MTNSTQTPRDSRFGAPYGRRVTAQRQALGRIGEELVAGDLQARGWRLLERNARPKGIRGELDLIAWDGRDVVFVEVKTGRAGAVKGPANPAELVGHTKRVKLRQLAGAWIKQNRARVPRGAGMRIDVVAQRLDRNDAIVWRQHLRGAV